jgi:hypothetical protein
MKPIFQVSPHVAQNIHVSVPDKLWLSAQRKSARNFHRTMQKRRQRSYLELCAVRAALN